MPILIINPIPGQEEENAEFLEESGSAKWVKKDEDFESFVQDMMQDVVLEELKANTKKIAKPNAGEEIYRIIFEK